MEQKYNQNCIENVLINGCVHYNDCSPAKKAIVILEKLACDYNEELQADQSQAIYLAHTVTNSNGEFCFFITDKTTYYKIKVFDNHHR